MENRVILKLGSVAFRVAHQSGKKIEQEARRRGGERRKRLILSGKHFSSSDLPVSASPVRYFLLWLSNEIEPTRNAAEPKLRLLLATPGTATDAAMIATSRNLAAMLR